MKKLLGLLILCGTAWAQTHITASNINGTCYVLDTLQTAVTCAGSSGIIEVPKGRTITMTGNITIPAGVTFRAPGPTNINTNGFTLTFSGGPIVAPPIQIFSGTGNVVGLSTIMPEWFGSTAINNTTQTACASTGCTVILQPFTTYQSALGSTSSCWSVSNTWFKGGGQPVPNSTYTALTNGTIIQGPLAFAGANGVRVTDLGVDNGSAQGASTTDGLVVTGVTGCTGSSSSDPLVTGTYVQNVTSMLSSGAVAFHAIRIEHNDSAVLRNLTAYFAAHGLALKSVNSNLDGFYAYGQGTDSLIMKSDGYTATSNNVVTNIHIGTISSANTALNAIMVDSEGSVPIVNTSISNAHVVNAQNGLVFLANGSLGAGAINGVDVNDYTYLTNSATMGLTQSVCVSGGGSGANTAIGIHMSHIDCINTVGGLNTIPMIWNIPLTDSVFENIQTYGANGAGSTFNGTNITVNGWVANQQTESKPFVIVSNTDFHITGYKGPVSLLSSSVSGTNASLNAASSGGIGLGFLNTTGLYFGNKGVTISATSTPTPLPGSGAQSGLLRLRDNTSGGAALFMIDPNGGSQLIGTSQITGLATAGDITFAGGQWNVTLTTGTTPRVLSWTIFD